MSRRFVAVLSPCRRKVGIVASTYRDFLKKCRAKFTLKKEKALIVTLDDGTEIDEEYFEFLDSDTELHVSSMEEYKIPDFINQLAVFLHDCLKQQPKIHDKVLELLQEALSSTKARALLELLAEFSDLSSVSSRESDTEWFKGLNTKFKTKESVMRNSAETRVRGYLDNTKRELLSDNPPEDSPCRQVIAFFKQQLSNCRYNAKYFDRTAEPHERLCDAQGLFKCEGPYDEENCPGIHFINPYTSREARIIFSTWNLDHVIEKSRTVLPTLKAALSGSRSSEVNLSYFHNLLFCHKTGTNKNSSGNLKLVHIACHVKKPHQLECEPRQIYMCKKTSHSSDAVDGLQLLEQHSLHPMITRYKWKRQHCYVDQLTSERPHVTKRQKV